jgi:NitT/TauT family transport system permease protein
MSTMSRRGQVARWAWRWRAPAVVAGLVIGLWYTVSYRLLTPDTRFLVPPPDGVVRVGFLDPVNRAELLDGLLCRPGSPCSGSPRRLWSGSALRS